jgi:hypothetical protein
MRTTVSAKTALTLASGKAHADCAAVLLAGGACAAPPVPASDFAEHAAVGPAWCRVGIRAAGIVILGLNSETKRLKIPDNDIPDLYNNSSLGVCPKCNEHCAGKAFLGRDARKFVIQRRDQSGHVAICRTWTRRRWQRGARREGARARGGSLALVGAGADGCTWLVGSSAGRGIGARWRIRDYSGAC